MGLPHGKYFFEARFMEIDFRGFPHGKWVLEVCHMENGF